MFISDPESITQIRAVSVTDTSISLKWDRPPGDMDVYEIEYQDPIGHLVKNITLDESITFRGLRPHHNYTFLVSVVSGFDTATIRRSSLRSKTFQTLESGKCVITTSLCCMTIASTKYKIKFKT